MPFALATGVLARFPKISLAACIGLGSHGFGAGLEDRAAAGLGETGGSQSARSSQPIELHCELDVVLGSDPGPAWVLGLGRGSIPSHRCLIR